ncbi:MAG: ABC transporter permease [Dehalobacterium sp.]
MLFTVVKTEMMKLRRAPVWITFFALPLLAAVMGTFNYLQNIGILTKEWYSLWTQHTIFSSFFFLPSLVGLLCAYQWRLEHRENNWNSLMTLPVPIRSIFMGKLIVAAGLVVLTQALTGALFIACGKYVGLSDAVPFELTRWLLLGVCAGISIASVQLLLSMIIKSFAIPVGIALMGGILGLAMASAGRGLFCPYSLLALGMNANGSGYLSVGDTLPFFRSCAAFTLLPALFAMRWLKKKDIETR